MKLQISPLPVRLKNRGPEKVPEFKPFETISAYVNGDLSLAQSVDQIAEPVEVRHLVFDFFPAITLVHAKLSSQIQY